MEHLNNRLVRVLILIFFCLAGCKKELESPETIDPIYTDLLKEAAASKAAREESEKALENFKKALEKTGPRTLDRRNAEDDLRKETDKLQRLIQIDEFNQIHLEMRKAEARRQYKIAFSDDKPWPDPKEFEAYSVNKRLRRASRSWSDRVPKTSAVFNTESSAAAPPKQKGGGGGEGGSESSTKEGVHHN